MNVISSHIIPTVIIPNITHPAYRVSCVMMFLFLGILALDFANSSQCHTQKNKAES